MNIGIIHLTDLHFTVKTNLINKIHPLCQAFHKDIRGISRLYFVISGDIANSGQKEEYEIARGFLSTIKTLTQAELPGVIVKYVFVPGNHDCDFAKENQVRIVAVPNIDYKYLGNDNSIIEACLSVQQDFWNFYSEYSEVPSDKLFYTITDLIEDTTITFNCINTAWMSQLQEKPGGLFFPVKYYLNQEKRESNLSFGVWHHPYNWITPNTTENNKKEFEQFTESIASTHFFGHEHEKSFYHLDNRISGERINLISGQVFNEDKKKDASGFQTVVIDSKSKKGRLRTYAWNKNMYHSIGEFEIDLQRDVHRNISPNLEFHNSLEQIMIPLVIDGRKDIRQSEIFVWPDMDTILARDLFFDNFISTQRLLEEDCKYAAVDGESQMGKSTLLSMMYLRLVENGKVPILLFGKDLKDLNVEKVVKRAFRRQYNETPSEYDKFTQMSISQKILLIDDFHESGFNTVTTQNFFFEAKKLFGKVILVNDSANTIVPANRAEFHDVKFYKLKPLGYKKRNELIEKYQMLKENPYTLNEQDFLDTVKTNFDNVQSILGDKLMPSYPLYILSILQALEYKPLKQNETSFGYCYQTLIHYSLYKAGVSNEDIGSYFNFLAELAFYFINKNAEALPENEISAFHTAYSNEYISPSYAKMIQSLIQSKILVTSEGNIRFGYNYILFYLSAKKIADIIHTPEGKQLVENLFKEVHIETNANILVFITHNSKDISFIEQCMLNSMLVLEKIRPITLEKNDPMYDEIEAFTSGLKDKILEENRNPRQERESMLNARDQEEYVIEMSSKEMAENDFDEAKKITLPFQQAYRSIEILGQIIKNRKGSLPKSQLRDMIIELYTTGFRTIGYVSELFISARMDIINMINDETKKSENAFEIEQEIRKFIQSTSLDLYLSVFTKLMLAGGNKDLKTIYNDVAIELNTPAAKMVTFSINSYYGIVSPEEVKALAEEFKNNQVALMLLRARVRSYVYHRNPDYKIKQKFADTLGLKLEAGKKKD